MEVIKDNNLDKYFESRVEEETNLLRKYDPMYKSIYDDLAKLSQSCEVIIDTLPSAQQELFTKYKLMLFTLCDYEKKHIYIESSKDAIKAMKEMDLI